MIKLKKKNLPEGEIMRGIIDLGVMFITPFSPIIGGLITLWFYPNAVIATAIGVTSFFGMMYLGRNIDMDL